MRTLTLLDYILPGVLDINKPCTNVYNRTGRWGMKAMSIPSQSLAGARAMVFAIHKIECNIVLRRMNSRIMSSADGVTLGANSCCFSRTCRGRETLHSRLTWTEEWP